MRVLLVSPSAIASLQILDQAFNRLGDQGALAYLCLNEDESLPSERREAAVWADVVFFFRCHEPQSLALLEWGKANGKVIVYGTDDDFRDLDPSSPLAQVYKDPHNTRAFETMVRAADLVWVFTEEMESRFRVLNPSIVVGRLPCPLELGRGAAPRSVGRDERTIKIGYAGSSTHARDLQVAIKPLRRLLDASKAAVRLELVNWAPPELSAHPQVTCLPYLDRLQDFYEYLAHADWSIGLALLENTSFNRAKTNNKYREYAAFGIPGIYSDMPVYSRCIRHCVTGFLTPHTEQGLWEALHTMVASPTLRSSIQRAALQDASTNYSPKAMELQLLSEISRLALARLAREGPKTRALIVGYEQVATTHIAGLRPAERLAREGWLEFVYREPSEVALSDVEAADFVCVVRAAAPEGLDILAASRDNDVPVIFCWDDDFFSLPTHSRRGQPHADSTMRTALRRFLRESDVVLASTPPLSRKSRRYNAQVVESHYGFAEPDCSRARLEPRPHVEDDRVVVGYFGLNAAGNLGFLVEALRRLRARYGRRLVLETIGLKPAPELASLVDWSWEERLSVDASLCLLKSRAWQIGLAPLADTTFNAAKQGTKFRDYAWCGAAMVCSDVPAYRRVILDGVHGLLRNDTATAWEDAVSLLLEDEDERTFLAAGARRLLEAEHSLAVAVAPWYQLLWRVAERRSASSLGSAFELRGSRAFSARRALAGEASGELEETAVGFLGIVRPGHSVSCRLRPGRSHWSALEVLLETNRDSHEGKLVLAVRAPSGDLLRQTSTPLPASLDRAWLTFRFPPIVSSSGTAFDLEFSLVDGPPAAQATLFGTPRAPSAEWAQSGSRTAEDSLLCRLWYSPAH